MKLRLVPITLLAKTAIQLPLSLFFSVAAHAAPPVWKATPDPNEQFHRVTEGADRVVVAAIGIKNRALVESVGDESVNALRRLFRFTGDFAGTFLTKDEKGVEMIAQVNCACDGDYVFTFFRTNAEFLSVSVHHWEHARSEDLVRGRDLLITPESTSAIKDFISKSDPMEARRIRLIDEYREKKAKPPRLPPQGSFAPSDQPQKD